MAARVAPQLLLDCSQADSKSQAVGTVRTNFKSLLASSLRTGRENSRRTFHYDAAHYAVF